MIYYLQQDGEWIKPQMKEYRLRCCDCGLVHILNFRITGNAIEFQAYRDNRATGQTRRRSELGKQIRMLMDKLEKRNKKLKYIKKNFTVKENSR